MRPFPLICGACITYCLAGTPDSSFGKAPLHFEPNHGQAAKELRYVAQAKGFSFGVSETEALFSGGIRLQWNTKAEHIDAEAPLGGHSNYIRGNDPAQWRMDVPHFTRVRARGVAPGVDMVFYGGSDDARKLEYDLEVAPGADPAKIRLKFAGAKSVRLDSVSGDLLIESSEGTLRQHKPVIYQDRDRDQIAGEYKVIGRNEVGFQVGPYDRTGWLVIDPVLTWSTYLGGSGRDYGKAIAVDPAGNVYVAGDTGSLDFPTSSSYQGANKSGDLTTFVSKFNTSGTALLYSTFFGGSGTDNAFGLAVDSTGNAYLAGMTSSADFPTKNAYQAVMGGSIDAFVAKFSPTGGLIYSTYLGGPGFDQAAAIAVDSGGSAYVTGYGGPGFPALPTPLPVGGYVTFVTKLDPSGSSASFSMALPDSHGVAIAVDSSSVYVAGQLNPSSPAAFPVKNPLQACSGKAKSQVFVSKLSAAAGSLIFSTCIGGSNDDAVGGLDIDSTGAIYLAGSTLSPDFPVLNAYQAAKPGGGSAFLTKIKPDGSGLVYSTFLGGSVSDGASAVRVDSTGRAYVGGATISPDFPLVAAIQSTLGRNGGTFLSQFSPSGALEFSTFFAGSNLDNLSSLAVDRASAVYLTGTTQSGDFPAVNALYPTQKAPLSLDAFAAKISPSGTEAVTVGFVTTPANLSIAVDGVTYSTPRAFSWTPGTSHTINGINNNTGTTIQTFQSWSIGGATAQTLITPSLSATYTANYTTQNCSFSFFVSVPVIGNSGSAPNGSGGRYAALGGVTTQAGCTWTATSNVPWLQISYQPSNSSGLGSFNYLVDANAPGTPARVATITVGSASQTVTQRPDPPSVTFFSSSSGPHSGATATLYFGFSAGDNGSTTIGNVLMNNFLDGRKACYLAYDFPNSVLYLVGDDGGSTTSAAFFPKTGSGNRRLLSTLSNSNCTIQAPDTFVNSSALTATIAFAPGFAGNKVVYTAVRGQNSVNSGWIPSGVWEVPQTANPLPWNTATTWSGVTGSIQGTISATYHDPASGRNLSTAQLLIRQDLDGRNACYLGYDHVNNILYIVNDTGSGLLPGSIKPGSAAGSIENSQCIVSAAGTTVEESGTDFTLNLNVTFKSGFTGQKVIYSGVQTTRGGNSGWQAVNVLPLQ